MDFGCLEGGSQELRDNWRNFGNEVIKPDGFKVSCLFELMVVEARYK